MLHPNDYPVIPRQYRIIKVRGVDHAAAMMPYPVRQCEDARCLNDEAFTQDLERVPKATVNYMKGKCKACPLMVACREYGIAHERYGIWGGTTDRERVLIRKERRQVLVEPHAAATYGMGDDYFPMLHYGNRAGHDADTTD